MTDTAEGTIIILDPDAALGALNEAHLRHTGVEGNPPAYGTLDAWVVSAGDLNDIGNLPGGRVQINFVSAEKDEREWDRELEAIAPFVANYTVDKYGNPDTGMILYECDRDDNWRWVFHAGKAVQQSPDTEWPALPGPPRRPALVYVSSTRDAALVASDPVDVVQLTCGQPDAIAAYLVHYAKIGRTDIVAKIRELLVYDNRNPAGAFTEELVAKIDALAAGMEAGTRRDAVKLSMKEREFLVGLFAYTDEEAADVAGIDMAELYDNLLRQTVGTGLSISVDLTELSD